MIKQKNKRLSQVSNDRRSTPSWLSQRKKFSQVSNDRQSTLFMLGQRKGVSPVIATVLLISMVVVIALIIFLWYRNMSQEAICKFEPCTNVEIVCNDIVFESSYSFGELYILNSGNVPLYSMKMRIFNSGSYETIDLQDIADSNWPPKGLNPGMVFSSFTLSSYISGADKVLLIPVLVGISKDTEEEKIYTCTDDFAKNLAIE